MRLRLLLAALLLAVAPVAAQTALRVGTPVEGALAGGGADAYTLALAAEQFVAGRALQHTADVVVTVTGPDGTVVEAFDRSARGADPFQFTAHAGGTYTVTVTPFEAEAGRYSLVVDRAEPVATTPEGTVRQLLAAQSGPDAPGALVAVVRDGAIVYEEAFGMANLTHGVPYALGTPTNIGSTSKQFTAYAINLLASRGQLRLDDDVRTVLPELPDLGATVTLRHLLTHTSGYREFLNTLAIGGRRLDEGDFIGRDEIVRLVQRQPRLQNAPGAEFNYNNTGFALLAQVVERVTGEAFPAWMAANVFAPMGMSHTVVRGHPGEVVPHAAQGYVAAATGWREAPDIGASMGAGGIYTTVADLARWMTALQDGTADRAIVRQMTTRNVLISGDTTAYGMGLFVDEMDGLRRIHHGGADAAHRSAFMVFPEIHAGVIVLTNAATDVDAVAARTARAFFADDFARAATAHVVPPSNGETPDVVVSAAAFNAFAGRYAMDEMPDFVLAFRRADDGRYLTQATGQGEVEIVPTSDSTFALTVVDASVTFHRDADGVVRSATLHQGGDHRATRLDVAPAAEASPLVLSDFAGRYVSDELEAFYTVAVEDEALVVQMPRQDVEPLRPLAGDRFGGPNGSTFTFRRSASGAVVGFTLDAGRTRDVAFDRAD